MNLKYEKTKKNFFLSATLIYTIIYNISWRSKTTFLRVGRWLVFFTKHVLHICRHYWIDLCLYIYTYTNTRCVYNNNNTFTEFRVDIILFRCIQYISLYVTFFLAKATVCVCIIIIRRPRNRKSAAQKSAVFCPVLLYIILYTLMRSTTISRFKKYDETYCLVFTGHCTMSTSRICIVMTLK